MFLHCESRRTVISFMLYFEHIRITLNNHMCGRQDSNPRYSNVLKSIVEDYKI